MWRALGRGAPGSTANASPVVSRLVSLASKNAPGASPSASAAHDMPARTRSRSPSPLRGAMRAHRGARVLRGAAAFVEAPRARPAPTRLASSPGRGRRRLLRRRGRRRRRRSKSRPTSSPLASASGVVVTNQANFLRVVVRPQDMSPGQIANRESQLSRAMARAGRLAERRDVDALRGRIDDANGPYELLCVVRALLKKIKRRVLVGDDVTITGCDWVDNRAMVRRRASAVAIDGSAGGKRRSRVTRFRAGTSAVRSENNSRGF